MTAVMVTTKHRGVFFGYIEGDLPGELEENESLAVSDVRMCVYWHASMKGILGLASMGPDSNCRISGKVDGGTRLYGVTAVFPVNKAAEKRWEEAPWI